MKIGLFGKIKKIIVWVIIFSITPAVILLAQRKPKPLPPNERINIIMPRKAVVARMPIRRTPLKKLVKRLMREHERRIKWKRKSKRFDPVVQNFFTKWLIKMPSPLMSFKGLGFDPWGAGWPPDTNGDVGTTYYIQAVNTSFGIFRKSDGQLVTATTFDDFFSGTGTPCDDNNMGDPIVLYDRYLQRWLVTDFAWSNQNNGPYYECIAMSQTNDPTGSWYLWAMRTDDDSHKYMADYPKLGVWSDAYYMTANMFDISYFWSTFEGVRVWALDKNQMANGTLTGVYGDLTQTEAWSLLPANSRGPNPPPDGAPNYMVAIEDDGWSGISQDEIAIWKFYFDPDTPSNSHIDGPITVATATFDSAQGEIPQKGTNQTLDSLSSRAMHSALYWNYGDHESLVMNHTVDTDGNDHAGIRWYELRDLNSSSPIIYQQGTYAPDANHRWMGSIAIDKHGSIAIGYSVSSSSMYPAIRYAGRKPGDALGTLGQGEASLIEGTGSQTTYNRWGDYSMLTIDPVDDVTFWYTTEYYEATGTDWQTRIGSFKLDDNPTVSITNPSNGATVHGYVNVTADGEDDFEVTKVEFYLDDNLQYTYTCGGSTTCSASWSWNTNNATDDSHVIKAIAYDDSSQTAEDSITVTVNNANNPPPGWSWRYGGSSDEYGRGAYFDGTDLLAAGYGSSYTSGGTDGLVYKINTSDHSEIWRQNYGGTSDDEFHDIVGDASGNLYLVGTTVSGTDKNILVYKINSSGTELWHMSYGGAGNEEGSGIALASDGNIIVVGYTETDTWGGKDVAVYKIDASDGSVIWSKHLGGSLDDYGTDVDVDSNGDIWIIGTTYSYTWGSGDTDIVVYKLASDGSGIFAKHYGGANDEYGYSIQAGSTYTYLVGTTATFTWGGTDIVNYGIFPDKGNVKWAWHYGSADNDEGYAVKIDTGGNLLITGSSMGYSFGGKDVLFYKVAYDTGKYIWAKHYGGSSDDVGYSVTHDNSGNYYVVGYTTTWGSGGADFYVFKMNGEGHINLLLPGEGMFQESVNLMGEELPFKKAGTIILKEEEKRRPIQK